MARGLPCDSQAAIRCESRAHARRQAGALVAQVGAHATDALAELPVRAHQRAVGPAQLDRGAHLPHLAAVALRDQAVEPLPELQEALRQPALVQCVVRRCGCRCRCRGAHCLLNCLHVIRRYGRDRNCWYRCCDADAENGNQGGLQWSSSCRGQSRPLHSLRSVRPSVGRLLCGVPMDVASGPSAASAASGVTAGEWPARSTLAQRRCHVVVSIRPAAAALWRSDRCGPVPFSVSGVFATRLTDKSIESLENPSTIS